MENTPIAITLTVAQWNVVMNALGGRPFAEVVAVITDIKSQADAALANAPAASPEVAEAAE